MRRLLILMTIIAATNAFAVAPQFWRTRTADEFLGGEVEGFAVTSRGELRAAPAVKKLATFNDPFVLSQTSSPNGDLFFGTGNEGKVYRLRGTDLKAIYTAPEPEVYAVAFRDGALYVGTSPNGKVYRVDPDSGKATTFFDPKQAYIWAMQFIGNGDLAIATGVEGKLFRVTSSGSGKVWFDSPDTHVRSIATRTDGSLLIGGSGKGRIYSVTGENVAHALYESQLNEISSIYVDRDGIGWAAGVSNVLPSSAPAKSQQRSGQNQQQSGSAQSSSETKKEEPASNVEVSFSFEDTSSSGATVSSQPGTGELYRINTDDFVEIARKFDREMVYAVSGGRDGSVMLSTGPQGRIYEVRDGEASLVANVPEKQVVSITTAGGGTIVTTTNSGAVYRLENTPTGKGEFRSAAKDVERFSRFGNYRIEGRGVGKGAVSIAFRSGNTRTPDTTWSGWSAPSASDEGAIKAPAGRYLQWKLTTDKPSDFVVEGVTVAFINRNVAPRIDGVSVQDPAVVFISSGYPAAPQVVEATNPDEYGIFSSLEPARDKNEQGKRVFRKGYRTIVWRAHDDNGDSLRYTVSFRQKGSDRWLRLRENVDETSVNFDTSQLPDGTYEVRVAVTDIVDNPESALTDTREGVEFEVDNTAPSVTSSTDGNDIVVRVTDSASAVGRVEYAADAQKWIRITPIDGIADSRNETYRIPKSSIAGKFVVVRAVDAFYNVDTESISVR